MRAETIYVYQTCAKYMTPKGVRGVSEIFLQFL